MVRKPLSKKTRFEVFKRDSFTCQYCGRKAPDVILHVDHIKAVVKGGDNDIFNLITSCADCNLGKRHEALDENLALEKQRKQLEDLQERKEQIEMLFKWKQGLVNIKADSTNMLVEYLNSLIAPLSISTIGRQHIEELVGKFGISEILDAMDVAWKQYAKFDDEAKPTRESIGKIIDKIGGIVINRRKGPIHSKVLYIRGICKNRFCYWDDKRGFGYIYDYVEALREKGFSEERIIELLDSIVMDLSKTARNWTEWYTSLEEMTEDVKNYPEIDE